MIELGLSRIAQLVKPAPPKWKAIHVAGTNGKGSVTAYISAILSAAGIRTGRFNSPHLLDRRDSISVQERPVSHELFRKAEKELTRRNKELGGGATEFEVLTGIAFQVFNEAAVDVAAVEVGVGGRLDATNVLEGKNMLVSVITKIGLDHQSLLGEDLKSIANEKAGIMKKGVPCIVDGSNDPIVLSVLSERAQALQTKLTVVTHEQESETKAALQEHMQKMSLAPYQISNLLLAAQATKTVEASLNLDSPIEESFYIIPSVSWPGRAQHINLKSILGRDTPALLDGAHNPQAAAALSTYVGRRIRQPGRPVIWVLAATEGKNITSFIQKLVYSQDIVITTSFSTVDGMPWVSAISPQDIAQAVRTCCDAQVELQTSDPGIALQHLRDLPPWHVVITGSLYLVSDVLRLLRSSNRATEEWTTVDSTSNNF